MDSLPPRICHLTVLNPALHSRIFYKEAVTQARAGYQVAVIGRGDENLPAEQHGVRLLPVAPFKRLSLKRLTARKEVLSLALAENADLYQIHSPELIGIAAAIAAQRPAAKFIYDVHEDYYLNIQFAGYYPSLFARSLAAGVRKRELKFAAKCDAVFLAEDCYLPTFEPAAKKVVMVRNKFNPPPSLSNLTSSLPAGIPVLAVTGTIAANWGTFRTLELWKKINRITPLKLLIAGHSHDGAVVDELLKLAVESGLEKLFELKGGKNYLPYEEVVKSIAGCTAGAALYSLKENIRDRIPTRFYELMAFGKPVLFTDNPPWRKLNDQLKFGIPLSQEPSEAEVKMLADYFSGIHTFPVQKVSAEHWSWQSEGENMLGAISEILKPAK